MSTIDFHNTTRSKIRPGEFRKAADRLLTQLGKSNDCLIEVDYVGKTKIKQLNNRFRRVARVTDVLSFPIGDFADQGTTLLGSIAICPLYAKEHRQTTIDLFVHGLLHLLGYDHESDNEFDQWEKIIQEFHLRH